MTLEEQRQDILSGAVYDDLTPELIKARQAAVLLTNAYNQAFGQDEKIRQELKKQYGKLPDYEINAIQHQMQNKLEASDVYKQREITEIDPETGA